MALFGKKETVVKPAGPGDPAPAESPKAPEYSPDKAAKFFEHARNRHEVLNFDYAMLLWLRGMRLDPTGLDPLKAFFESAAGFLSSKEGAKGPGKELRREVSSRNELEKYLAALLETATDPHSSSAAVRAVTCAAALGAVEPVKWLGERALVIAGRDKKPRKDHFVRLFDAFGKFGAYDKAVQAGEMAARLDPEDSRLAADVRNMSAQQTMARGGFEEAGKAGGYRSNVRDSEKQTRLQLEEKTVKTEEELGRLVALAKADYDVRPADKTTIRKYAKALLDRASPADEEAAHALLMSAYESTQEFDFRRAAGEIRLRQARRRLARLQADAQQPGANGTVKEAFERARRELLEHEIAEYEARVKAYPTDLGIKFELGRRLFDAGRFEESIGLFQESKAEIKNRLRSMLYLGNAFVRVQFPDMAIDTFREAMDGAAAAGGGGVAADPETAMELRYGLMVALTGRAEEAKDLTSAEEAYKIASSIAMQQFNYKDVRARQLALKQLIASIKQG